MRIKFEGKIAKMQEWNEFKETANMLIQTVIGLLVLPTVIFVVVMWGKFLLTIYETVWG